ncbi:MAG: hypothetical protein EXS09_03400 [Gemmataceae bacterium]|nr:hypothetical protein [Gemmataceae bacterium]
MWHDAPRRELREERTMQVSVWTGVSRRGASCHIGRKRFLHKLGANVHYGSMTKIHTLEA